MKTLEPKTAKFLEELKAKDVAPIETLSIVDARERLVILQDEPIEKLPAKLDDRTIPCGPEGQISIRIVRPPNVSEKLPILMYFHGGGWVIGNKDTHDRLLREFAHGAHAAVVFVNYSLSPEVKYPIALEQAYAATHFIAQHAESLNLDSTRIAVAGDSAGGNLATVVTLLAKERGGPKINYQVLFYPVTDANFHTESYDQFAEGPLLTRSAMEWFWNAYEPNLSSRKNPTLSPLQAALSQLKHLPPALIITAENDVLRDEGEAYAHKLAQAGVEVTAVRYLGTIHDFVLLNPLAETPAAKSAIALANMNLHKIFTMQKKSLSMKAA